MRKVILHIGGLKTATTTIQSVLFKQREKLIEHNINYLSIRPTNHNATFWKVFSGYRTMDMPIVVKKQVWQGKNYDDIIADYKAVWHKELSNNTCETFIISAELMSHMPLKNIVALKWYLLKYFESFTIIVYVRHYKDLISSITQEYTKTCHRAYRFDKQVDRLFGKQWYTIKYRAIGNWIKVFGRKNVIIRPFDKHCFKDGDIIKDFLFNLGLDIQLELAEEKKNESLGNNATLFLEKYNIVYPRFINKQFNLNRGMAVRGLPFSVLEVEGDSKFSYDAQFTKKEVRRLNREITWINRFFKEGYSFEKMTEQIQTRVTECIPEDFFKTVFNNFAILLNERIGFIKRLVKEKDALIEKLASIEKRSGEESAVRGGVDKQHPQNSTTLVERIKKDIEENQWISQYFKESSQAVKAEDNKHGLDYDGVTVFNVFAKKLDSIEDSIMILKKQRTDLTTRCEQLDSKSL